MTIFEVLSILIACIAAFISLVVWNGQRKLQRESLELQKATSDLAKKQLEVLVNEDKGKSSARLKLDLVDTGKHNYKFYLTNIGSADALDVTFELLLRGAENSPLVPSEFDEKLPAPKLSPGSKVGVIAAIDSSTPLSYNAILKWTNPDGSRQEDTTYASL